MVLGPAVASNYVRSLGSCWAVGLHSRTAVVPDVTQRCGSVIASALMNNCINKRLQFLRLADKMADEAGFLELLVANERIGRWLDILCDPYQRIK